MMLSIADQTVNTETVYPRARFIYTALEPFRLPLELLSSRLSSPLLSRQMKGDGHPVVILPPFMGSDRITQALRKNIESWGYDARGWGLGTNEQTSGSGSMLEALTERKRVSAQLLKNIDTIANETGCSVTLIGWSLGGLHALDIAQEIPDAVRQVITLGSPIGDPRSTAIYALMNSRNSQPASDDEMRLWLAGLDDPLNNVPFTCVYSNSDGVVDPKIAMITPGYQRENIVVNSTHVGMAFNSRVHFVIADRLRGDENNWSAMETPAWLNWAV